MLLNHFVTKSSEPILSTRFQFNISDSAIYTTIQNFIYFNSKRFRFEFPGGYIGGGALVRTIENFLFSYFLRSVWDFLPGEVLSRQ